MPEGKCILSKEDIAAITYEIEGRVVDPLKRRMNWEGKKVESQIKGLSFALEHYLEKMKGDITQAIRENEQSVEVVARELARRGEKNNDTKSSNSLP